MNGPVSEEMRSKIVERLSVIEAEEDATILLAVESGSRAWGFHSPDSDYDVRFIYSRPIDWHLNVSAGRDVIERPISDVLDLSGWDLRKTLGLILRSNAVVLEWLQSPILYRDDSEFRRDLLEFGRATLRRKPVMWHYLRLAERQSARLHNEAGLLRLKKYFYVIRPVLALRWLRLRPEASAPPMNMQALLDGSDPPPATRALIEELVVEKSTVAELGAVDRSPAEIDALIAQELAAAKAFLDKSPPESPSAQKSEADLLHQKWTRRTDRASSGLGSVI